MVLESYQYYASRNSARGKKLCQETHSFKFLAATETSQLTLNDSTMVRLPVECPCNQLVEPGIRPGA
jgi:hypothetical protein